MLNKRTNILFTQDLWKKLVELSEAKRISVGQLVREAVQDKYLQEEVLLKRQNAISKTLEARVISKKIDYQSLINYGHKY